MITFETIALIAKIILTVVGSTLVLMMIRSSIITHHEMFKAQRKRAERIDAMLQAYTILKEEEGKQLYVNPKGQIEKK